MTADTRANDGGARLLDGRACARTIRKEIKEEVQALKEDGIHPHLVVVRVGNDPASEIYVGAKRRAAGWVDIRSTEHHLDDKIAESDLMELLGRLNEDDDVDGVLLQLPLPDHLDPDPFIEFIRADKDVDGFHPLNLGRMLAGTRDALLPCTPRGIIELMRRNGIGLHGKNAVVIGRSNIVGKPMAVLLDRADCTVTLCHTETADLQAEVERADVLVVATGVAELVPGDWIKPGAVVIDVGQSRRDDGSIVGDVHFESASEQASWITPVPGGVGPMTVAMLLQQTVVAAKVRRGLARLAWSQGQKKWTE